MNRISPYPVCHGALPARDAPHRHARRGTHRVPPCAVTASDMSYPAPVVVPPTCGGCHWYPVDVRFA
eukprot:scaffold2928_cov304-Prasinococcus_capsulatus_cf.AAC.1